MIKTIVILVLLAFGWYLLVPAGSCVYCQDGVDAVIDRITSIEKPAEK